MKVLLHVNYWEGEGRLERLLKLADSLPYDGIEFRAKYRFADLTQQQYQDRLARYKQDHPEKELVFSGSVPFTRGTADEIRKERDFCLSFFDWAAKNCGTKIFNFFTGPVVNQLTGWGPGEQNGSAIATEDDFRRTAEGLREMAEGAKKNGMLLALETHNNYLHDLADPCRKLLDLCGHPAAGINYDQCNMSLHKLGSKPEDIFSKLSDKIYYAHLKNYFSMVSRNAPGPIYTICRLSDGVLDTRSILERLAGLLKTGMLALEYPAKGDGIYAAEQDIRYMRRLIEDLGLK